MSRLITLVQAIQAGKIISNPAKWKNIQNLTNALAALVSLVIVLLRLANIDLPLTDEQIVEIAGAIAVILGIANGVATTVTTKKIGTKETTK